MLKDAAHINGDESRDQACAWAISIILHLMAFAWVWLGIGAAGAGKSDGAMSVGGLGTSADFLAETVFRQRILPVTSSTERSSTDDAIGIAEDVADATSALEHPIESALADTTDAIVDEAAPSVEGGAEAAVGLGGKDMLEGQSSEQNALRAAYLSALRTAIQAKWPHDDTVHPCRLLLKQTPGGLVESSIAGDCELSIQDRRSLEAAALMAQPLPYAGFESVYSDTLILDFQYR